MCRLFGFRSSVPSQAHRSLLDAECLSRPVNQAPRRLGIGWFVDEDAYVIKSATAAHACDRFKSASQRLTSHTFVVHVRKATVGVVDHLNAHPFRFGRWLFAHNGTILGMEKLADWLADRTDPKLTTVILGDTDSERLFYYLLSGLIAAGVDQTGRIVPDAELVGKVIRQLLFDLDAAAEALGVERPITKCNPYQWRYFCSSPCRDAADDHNPKALVQGLLYLPCTRQDLHGVEAPRAPPGQPSHRGLEPIGTDENIWEELPDGTTVALQDNFSYPYCRRPKTGLHQNCPNGRRLSCGVLVLLNNNE